MLVVKDYTGKNKAKYICDRCKIELTTETRKAICVQEPKESAKKKWDLCSKCFRALCRGIERGV